jgi:predicted HTH transcriptional regulator
MLFGKKLDQISAVDLNDLVANEVREDRHIDFKESLPGRKESDKKDFLADVSAFANSASGDIVYGVREILTRRFADSQV